MPNKSYSAYSVMAIVNITFWQNRFVLELGNKSVVIWLFSKIIYLHIRCYV